MGNTLIQHSARMARRTRNRQEVADQVCDKLSCGPVRCWLSGFEWDVIKRSDRNLIKASIEAPVEELAEEWVVASRLKARILIIGLASRWGDSQSISQLYVGRHEHLRTPITSRRRIPCRAAGHTRLSEPYRYSEPRLCAPYF